MDTQEEYGELKGDGQARSEGDVWRAGVANRFLLCSVDLSVFTLSPGHFLLIKT